MRVRPHQSSSSTTPDVVVCPNTQDHGGVLDEQQQQLPPPPPQERHDVHKVDDDSDPYHSHDDAVIIGPLCCSSESLSSSSSTATTASTSSFCSLSSSFSSGGGRPSLSSGHPNNHLSVSFNSNVLVMDIEYAKWHYSPEEIQSSWYHKKELARQRRTSRHLAETMDFYTDEELFDRFGISSQQSMMEKARRIEQSKLLAQLLLDQEGCTWVPFDTCEENDSGGDSNSRSCSRSGGEVAEEDDKELCSDGSQRTGAAAFDAAADTIRRIGKRFTALSVESSIMAQHRALCIAQQLHGAITSSKSREDNDDKKEARW